MEISELGQNAVKVTLRGRLDAPGVMQIEPGFVTALVPNGRNAIVDLSQVEFIASLGIRMFLTTARGLGMRQSKLVLFGPQEAVREILDEVSLDTLIAIVNDEAAALAALKA
jgi:anti-sigma B factor antagonist